MDVGNLEFQSRVFKTDKVWTNVELGVNSISSETLAQERKKLRDQAKHIQSYIQSMTAALRARRTSISISQSQQSVCGHNKASVSSNSTTKKEIKMTTSSKSRYFLFFPSYCPFSILTLLSSA